MTLFATGIRPAIDEHLAQEAAIRRDYGDYWSASSAGYCLRRNIFERIKLPYTNTEPRKQRIFTAGHVFHQWIQGITQAAGISLMQETELQDEELMIRGHIDDLVRVNGKLILYDYKTQNTRAFTWQKRLGTGMSYFHKMQLGTYMHMMRSNADMAPQEARILKISKDDLRMGEEQLLWSMDLSLEVVDYWTSMNEAWEVFKQDGTLPPCTCADHEGGFLASAKYNPFFYQGEPCSEQWYKEQINAKEEI